MHFSGELMGSLNEQVCISIPSTIFEVICHSGVNLVKVSLGNFAQYLKLKMKLYQSFLQKEPCLSLPIN